MNHLTLEQWCIRWGLTEQAKSELYASIAGPEPLPQQPAGRCASETDVQNDVRIRASELGNVLLRNNNGAMQDGERIVRFGLGNDSKRLNDVRKSSDLIGITKVTVTHTHVGKTVGVFTAAEMKPPGWHIVPSDKRAHAQETFMKFVRANCGIAGFCTSRQDYDNLISIGIK